MKRVIRPAAASLILGVALLVSGCEKDAAQDNLSLGMEAVVNMDYNSALDYFEKAMVNGEDSQLIYRGQGLASMGLGQYEDAVLALEKSLTSTQTAGKLELDTNYYLATAYYKSGEIDKAIQTYDAILGIMPKEIQALYLRGTLELKKGDYEKAVKDFDAAIALAPLDYSMYIDIYKSLDDNGYQEIAQTYLQGALEGDEKSLSDYDRGRIYYYLKDYENARNFLEKANSASGTADVVLMLGKTYEALGDYNYASTVYDNYLAGDPTSPQLYNQLGLCKLSLKEYDAALSAFQSGIAIENNDYMQTLRFNEIVTFEYLGEFKKAFVQMETYLKTYPGDAAAEREYEFLKTR